MRAGISWMFLIIGTTIGAGYASGQELWQFFGHESGLAIVLFTIFFATSCIVIMLISYQQQSTQYLPVLKIIVGKRLTRIYDIMIFIYLFTTTVVMIAGSGATAQAFNLSYWWGIALIIGALILLFIKGINGLISMNEYILPLLLAGLLYVLLKFTLDQEVALFSHLHQQRNWTAAFPFTALNILPLIAILGAIGSKIKSRKEVFIAGIGSACVLGAISFIYNSSLIQISEELLLYEIPLFAILKNYPVQMLIFMSALLWFAIFTTAASSIMGIITRLAETVHIPMWLMVVCLISTMLPLTTLGFSTLISYIYPVYGILNLYVLTRLLLYPLWYKQSGCNHS